MDGGEVGGVNRVGMGDVNGDIEARMENADGDSGTSTLQSMGYIDSDAGTGRTDGDSTDSGHSVLKPIVITAVVAFFGLSCLYFLLSGILAMFGVQL